MTATGTGSGMAGRKQAMLEALGKSLGVVAMAADMVGISRVTHYEWLGKDPEYAASVESLKNIALDFAESKLHKQIEAGNITAIIFFLKTQGKGRGYVERFDIGEVAPVRVMVDPVDYSKLSDGALREFSALMEAQGYTIAGSGGLVSVADSGAPVLSLPGAGTTTPPKGRAPGKSAGSKK